MFPVITDIVVDPWQRRETVVVREIDTLGTNELHDEEDSQL